MPTATTNLHYWFFTLFEERYESCGPDEDDVKQSMRDVIGVDDEWKSHTHSLLLKEWCEEQLKDTHEVPNYSLLSAIMNTVDWVKVRQELFEWVNTYDEQEREKDEQEAIEAEQKEIEKNLRAIKVAHDEKEEEEEEEEEEETCYSCEETKTDNWYYNLTPVKNAPVCTACRDREETCGCCEIKYPYYQIKHDGGGKYVCITCDNECPCHDSKCGTVCPAITKIIDGLATKA